MDTTLKKKTKKQTHTTTIQNQHIFWNSLQAMQI